MIAFLSNHFRYNVSGSNNPATSYAVNIKVNHLDLTNVEQDRAYEGLDAEYWSRESGFSDILQQFNDDHENRWQIGTNGRSGGYAVLYTGGEKDSGYKSCCTACGQNNYTVEGEKCGRCGQNTRIPLRAPIKSVFTYPGKGVDCHEEGNYEEWDLSHLRSRVKLVWEFGLTVEDACRSFLDWATTHKVVEETVMVPTKIRVAVPR